MTNEKQTNSGRRKRLLFRAKLPGIWKLVPRDVASRAAKKDVMRGYGVGTQKMAVYLDFGFNCNQ